MLDAKPIAERLHDLVEQLVSDTDLSDDDRVLVHDTAVAAVQLIQTEKEWAKTAHVHDEPHLPLSIVTGVQQEASGAWLIDDSGAEAIFEEVDVSDFICHDCRRGLVNDAGELHLLVCPKLHGRRPRALIPQHSEGAVECGQAGS